MSSVRVSCIALVLALGAATAPAAARVAPYVRVAYAGDQLRMADGNQLIKDAQAGFRAFGLPASFREVGLAWGPNVSAGVWLLPGFRVGATYAYGHSVRVNHLHVPGQIFYADDLDFGITELGMEAAVHVERLAGLTLGGHAARTRGRLIEGFTVQDGSGNLFQDATAEKTMLTYGGYLGLEQTSAQGVVGYLHAGYQFRDLGTMPSQLTISDGNTTTLATGTTIDLDYSGFYMRVGVGYDFWH
jgi:hypothetical protein